MYLHAKHKRIAAIFLCALFIAALVFSLVYIDKEANHHCIGDNCPICGQIQLVQRTIDQLGSALVLIFYAGYAFTILCVSLLLIFLVIVICTPITLGVRMNN